MRSKASINGHSIHPIMVSFPIAFFIGAFITDVFFVTTYKIFFYHVSNYLLFAGIIFTVLAAIPGIIDYFFTVPPESSAKERATKHGLLNISMLFVFTMAFLLRQKEDIDFIVVLLLEIAGVALLSIAGWLGGTLVSRNQIGVDHRYANAGRWQEERIHEPDSDTIELKNIDHLKMNQMKLLHVNGKRIVVGRTASDFVAFEDRCRHKGGSLADGALICEIVQCPWHGSQFNVDTGIVVAGPAKEPIKTYKVEQAGGKYYLHI